MILSRLGILQSQVRTLILLPKDFRKLNRPLHYLFPSSSFESEAHRLASFADRGQLEEIARNDKLRDGINSKDHKNAENYTYLNASEGSTNFTSDNATDRGQLIEKFTIDH